MVLPVKCIKWFKYKFGIIHAKIAPLRRASIIVSILYCIGLLIVVGSNNVGFYRHCVIQVYTYVYEYMIQAGTGVIHMARTNGQLQIKI